MKKFFLIYTILTLSLGIFLIGCSKEPTGTKTGSEKGGTKEFTYWYPWGGDSEKWDNWRMDKFAKEYPDHKIHAVYAPPDGGLSNGKLLSAISGSNPPDVVISNDYAAAYALAAQGALEPLDEYLQGEGFDDSTVLPSFHDVMKFDGETYLFPQDSNVNLLYYNVKMFEEAGLDPNKPPTTIEELDEYAEKLTSVNNGKIDRLGFIPWIDAGDDSLLWGWVFGANFYDAEANKVLIDEKPLEDAYNWMNSYAQKYNPEKIKSFTSGFGGAFSPDHPFFNGKVAMTINGNWFANALSIYSPDTEYRVAAIPNPEGGREKATTLGTNVFMIPKGAKNPEAAIKFIIYGGQPEILADNINEWRSISIYKEPSDAIKWGAEGDEVYEVVTDVAASPNSGHPALTSIAGQIKNELTLVRDGVIYNDKDPKPLLEEAKKKLQKEADKK
ncbi:ABC transporter substrate-binding protein [Lederbergia lenta]|uniref:ABC transporter substrate-binding protein n=1 Tax=Lederbergia lenta TaxID=1467 RepID=UPI00203A6DCB|nr:ABC transporter substrate-binding protein [Lederbergia lenta]MCM3110982.1 ABC transporter substrate-binding protein [Lederbergia lenta]